MRMVTTVAIIMNTIKKYMAFMTDMMAVIFALRMFQLFSPLLHHYDMRCFTPPCCRLPDITQKKESPAPGKHQKISQSQTGFSGLTRWQPAKTNKADISRRRHGKYVKIRERIKNRPVDSVAATDKHKYSAILGKGGAIWKTATK